MPDRPRPCTTGRAPGRTTTARTAWRHLAGSVSSTLGMRGGI